MKSFVRTSVAGLFLLCFTGFNNLAAQDERISTWVENAPEQATTSVAKAKAAVTCRSTGQDRAR